MIFINKGVFQTGTANCLNPSFFLCSLLHVILHIVHWVLLTVLYAHVYVVKLTVHESCIMGHGSVSVCVINNNHNNHNQKFKMNSSEHCSHWTEKTKNRKRKRTETHVCLRFRFKCWQCCRWRDFRWKRVQSPWCNCRKSTITNCPEACWRNSYGQRWCWAKWVIGVPVTHCLLWSVDYRPTRLAVDMWAVCHPTTTHNVSVHLGDRHTPRSVKWRLTHTGISADAAWDIAVDRCRWTALQPRLVKCYGWRWMDGCLVFGKSCCRRFVFIHQVAALSCINDVMADILKVRLQIKNPI